MLDKLTIDDFLAHVNGKFQVQLDGTEGEQTIEPLELALVEVSSLGTTIKESGKRQSFSILFLGPYQPVLPQQIYTLRHQKMGRLPLFLVPLGPRDEGMLYEAVFS
jgi:hypothetical protein